MHSARHHLHFALLLLICAVSLVRAIPAWEGMNGRGSIGSLVPGASYIEAMGPPRTAGVPLHLSPDFVDRPGNLSLTYGTWRAPPFFYINQRQLWLLVNETTVYPVNVHNVTGQYHPDLHFQLIVGAKQEGLRGGEWRWKSTALYYDLPGVLESGNHGLYHLCWTPNGRRNIFIQARVAPPPPDCEIMTLHSLMRDRERFTINP